MLPPAKQKMFQSRRRHGADNRPNYRRDDRNHAQSAFLLGGT
jgi:hypothetical protein